MQKILLATRNTGKTIEMREALAGLPFTLVTPSHLSIEGAPDETGSSYAENATIKAKFFYDRSKLPTIADDSGIQVDALTDELGVFTRRWGAGPDASDEEWIGYFLERMRKEKNKRARFLCTIAHIDQDGRAHLFEGTCDGVITDELEAEYLPGLPISACFKPDGEDLVFSGLSIEQKNRTSHRGKALSNLREFLSAQTDLSFPGNTPRRSR